MQIIYKAADIVEAHLVAGMLKNNGIEAYVSGHYLQGGVGDLSPFGFANVFIEDHDLAVAEPLIRDYELSGHEPDVAPATTAVLTV